MSVLGALSFLEWVNIVGVIGGLFALVGACISHINKLEHRMDLRTQSLEEAIRRIDVTMLEVKSELKKASELLNADLAWRYLYQNDPTRKNLAPRYDPHTRTLEFVDTTGSQPIRNP